MKACRTASAWRHDVRATWATAAPGCTRVGRPTRSRAGTRGSPAAWRSASTRATPSSTGCWRGIDRLRLACRIGGDDVHRSGTQMPPRTTSAENAVARSSQSRWSSTRPTACIKAYAVVGPTNLIPAAFKTAAERDGLRRAGRNGLPRGRPGPVGYRMIQDQPGEVLAQPLDHPGVGDRGLDLGPVPDDPRIAHQPLDIGLVEPGHPVGLEAGECGPKVLPLAQDREPGQVRTGRPSRRHPLVQAGEAGNRPPGPTRVVIVEVFRCRQAAHGQRSRPSGPAARITGTRRRQRTSRGSAPNPGRITGNSSRAARMGTRPPQADRKTSTQVTVVPVSWPRSPKAPSPVK